jgi:hypothetical protein
VVRWHSANVITREWFSSTRENRLGWAANHQGRQAKAEGEACQRPLQA